MRILVRNQPTKPVIDPEQRVDDILDTMQFLYNEVTASDDTVIRAMIVLGATDDQITEAISVAAVATQVDRQSKARYSYGVLKNLMMENEDPS